MRIAMLLHKTVEHDSRVRREAQALAEAGHEVTVLHLPRVRGELDGELDGFAVRSATPSAWVRERLPSLAYRLVFLWAFVRAVRRLRPDAVHAHDAAMLAPGWLGARLAGALLVYDSHEYAAGVPYRKRLWAAFVECLERALVGRCDAVITVSDGIAKRLRERYQLEVEPTVVRNLPDPSEADPAYKAPDLRELLGAPAAAPLVLHLGAAAVDRGCETLVAAMRAVPEAHLLFLGVDDERYAERLARLAGSLGIASRVHLLPSVPVGQIRAHVGQATLGVTLLEDTCENHRLALPNKAFEYLEAGIPVLTSDLPELRRAIGGRDGVTLVDAGDVDSVGRGLGVAIDGAPGSGVSSPARWEEDAARLAGLYGELAGPGPGMGDRALVLVRNGVSHDARVQREARLLAEMGYDVTIAGVATAADPRGEERLGEVRILRHAPGRLRRALGKGDARPAAGAAASRPPENGAAARATLRTRARRLAVTADYYRSGLGLVLRLRPRLIHANDYNTVWIGIAGKLLAGSRLLYDSHELWPDRNLRPESRRWLVLCERLFVRVADEVLTTSPGYAQVLARRYGIAEPRVVRNLPEWSAAPEDRRDSRGPLAVYFGAITRNRGLATALRALALAPELRMRFVGPEAWGYRAELERLATELGVAERLELLDPVPPDRAADVLVDADVGLALIEPACLSYEMTLPNKLYEYVAAGLPVLASEVPVLAGEVRENEIGLSVDPRDPAAVAEGIERMTTPAARSQFRASVARLAPSVKWSLEREKLMVAYNGERR